MSGSNTFGGTIKLEGEKEYRKAISQINSDLKVLASEMGKVTAEFGKNNKSVSSLSSQSKVLNEQIKNQKEKIATLKGALEEASEKYGENDKRTNNWRTSLNKAETQLSKMEKNLSDVNSEMTKCGSPLEKLTAKISEQENELRSLQTEYKNVVLEQGKNSTEAKELAGQIKNLNGVTFTSWSTNVSKQSYTDFSVILTEQNIGLPSPKIYSVSIEGMDGSLDLSECFGEMKYENRTLKFTFESIDKINDWQAKMINISSFLHGQKMKIKTWSDPNFYYVGRCKIDQYNSSSKLGKVVISCDCEPFKYKNNITNYNLVEGTNTVNNSRMTVYADLINEAEITINTKVYSAGTHLRAIKLISGANTLNSSGNATLNFQEGEI